MSLHNYLDICCLSNEIVKTIFKLKESDCMFMNTSYINLNNISNSTDYLSIANYLQCYFISKNDKKIFNYQNSKYSIVRNTYYFDKKSWCKYTISIYYDD